MAVSKKRAGRERKAINRTVRPGRIPITRALLDQFGQELHFSLMKAELGHFTTTEFDKIGTCFNTIYGALDLRPPKDKTVLVAIEGAMHTIDAPALKKQAEQEIKEEVDAKKKAKAAAAKPAKKAEKLSATKPDVKAKKAKPETVFGTAPVRKAAEWPFPMPGIAKEAA